jgi:FAD:protein FMN transferase
MNSRRQQLNRLTIDAILLALALVLSIVERWIPLELIVPVPGLKLGLANIVTLFALLRLKPQDALIILLVRCLVMGAITGPMTLLFSLAGGFLAFLAMWLLSRWEGRAFSVIGISLAGAAAHNIGQVSVAGLVLSEPLLLLTYLPPLLLTGLFTGTLTGIAAFPVIRFWKSAKPPEVDLRKGSANPPVLRSLLLFLLLSAILLTPLSLTGCTTGGTTSASGLKKYSYEFTGTFDTAIQLIGYSTDEKTFATYTAAARQRFEELNKLFDAYHAYPGLNNLKTINDQAGAAPVKVAAELVDLVSLCLEWNQTISDKTNIALGQTIVLWQAYRDRALADPQQAALPSGAEIAAALAHSDIRQIMVDKTAGTIFLADPDMRLDLGAVGKGYATALVVQELQAMGATSMIINAGGSNVSLIGKPGDDRATWSVGLQNPAALLPDRPDIVTPGAQNTTAQTTAPAAQQATTQQTTSTGEVVPELIAILHMNQTSIVTSGDYQRYYIFNGQVYHHLIDPASGMPASYYRAVTVVTKDAGLADFLSTALFLLPYDQSRKLAESLPGVDVVWIFPGGRLEMTDGLKTAIEVNP